MNRQPIFARSGGRYTATKEYQVFRYFLRLSFSGLPAWTITKFALAILLCMLSAILQVLAPLCAAGAIDELTKAGSPNAVSVSQFLLLFLGLRFLGNVLADVRWVTLNPILYAVTYNLGSKVTQELATKLGRRQFNLMHGGALSECIAIVQKTQLSMMTALQQITTVILPASLEIAIAGCIISFSFGSQSSALLLLSMSAFVISAFLWQKMENRALLEATKADNHVFSKSGEYISLHFLVDQYYCGPLLKSKVAEAVFKSLDRHKRYLSIKALRALLKSVCMVAFFAVAVLALVFMASEPTPSASQVFIVIYYADRIFAPLNLLATAIANLRGSLVALSIGKELLEQTGDRLAWNGRTQHDSVPANVRQGTWINVKGASGTGKTTLVRKRFLEHSAEPSDLRDPPFHCEIYLDKDTQIIPGTVEVNIGLGAFPTQDVKAAFELFWTPLRANGSRVQLNSDIEQLSGGERQVLAVARAYLRTPRILILDEATGALDAFAEQTLLATLKQQLSETTVYFISHRSVRSDLIDMEIELINYDMPLASPATPAVVGGAGGVSDPIR